jgi:hypothetical protein
MLEARMKKEKSAAIVTVFDAPKMTKRGRKEVAAWLRRQAEFLEKDGEEYAGKFRARYLYR